MRQKTTNTQSCPRQEDLHHENTIEMAIRDQREDAPYYSAEYIQAVQGIARKFTPAVFTIHQGNYQAMREIGMTPLQLAQAAFERARQEGHKDYVDCLARVVGEHLDRAYRTPILASGGISPNHGHPIPTPQPPYDLILDLENHGLDALSEGLHLTGHSNWILSRSYGFREALQTGGILDVKNHFTGRRTRIKSPTISLEDLDGRDLHQTGTWAMDPYRLIDFK